MPPTGSEMAAPRIDAFMAQDTKRAAEIASSSRRCFRRNGCTEGCGRSVKAAMNLIGSRPAIRIRTYGFDHDADETGRRGGRLLRDDRAGHIARADRPAA